jgi:hypothetical protein
MHVDENSYYSFFVHRPLVTDANGSAFMVYSALCVDEFGKLDLLSNCGLDVPTDANENDVYILMISDNETHKKIYIDVTYSQNYQDAVNRAWRDRDRKDVQAFIGSVDWRVNLATFAWPPILLFFLLFVVHTLGIKRIDAFDKAVGPLKFIWRKVRKKPSRIVDIPTKEEEFRREREKTDTRIEYVMEQKKEQNRVIDEMDEELETLGKKRDALHELEESAKHSDKPFTKDELDEIRKKLGPPEGGKKPSRS